MPSPHSPAARWTARENPIAVYQAAKLHTVGEAHHHVGLHLNDPLMFVVNKDIWNSWTPADREIVKQAAIDAGKGRNRHRPQRHGGADKPCSRKSLPTA